MCWDRLLYENWAEHYCLILKPSEDYPVILLILLGIKGIRHSPNCYMCTKSNITFILVFRKCLFFKNAAIFSILLIKHNSAHSLARTWLISKLLWWLGLYFLHNQKIEQIKIMPFILTKKWDPLLWKLEICTCILQECGMSCCLLNTQNS